MQINPEAVSLYDVYSFTISLEPNTQEQLETQIRCQEGIFQLVRLECLLDEEAEYIPACEM